MISQCETAFSLRSASTPSKSSSIAVADLAGIGLSPNHGNAIARLRSWFSCVRFEQSFARGFPGRRGIDTAARSNRDFSFSLSLSPPASSTVREESARPISNGASSDTLTWMTGIHALKSREHAATRSPD